jgi:hypothetical protein
MTTTTPPTDPYEAAQWLLDRHRWPARLVARVADTTQPAGWWYDDDGQTHTGWLDDLAQGFDDLDTWTRARTTWERTHPAPRTDTGWDTWDASGPQPTPTAQALACMSTGERDTLRLLATLHPNNPPHTALVDLPTRDHRGVRLLIDHTRLVLARCAWDPNGHAALTALTTTSPTTGEDHS